MNTFRLVRVINFPKISVGEECHNSYNFTIPGFTEDKQTKITNISTAYYGFEYYEIQHEMLIKDKGLAFGYVDEKPVKMELNGYKKTFNIKCYYNPEENYAFLSETSWVVKDLIRTLKKDDTLGLKIEEVELNFNELENFTDHFSGAWFKGVSSRVSASAMFGADLSNEPLFNQLKEDGADLSSITIPYKGIQVQLSKKGGISSHQKISNIQDKLGLIRDLKLNLLDKIVE